MSALERPARAVGRRINRFEDPRLLRGHGRYVADLVPADGLTAFFVRSPTPHGVLTRIDASAALALPGVHGFHTHADIAELGARPLRVGWNHPGQRIEETPLLAAERVVYAGQPVAIVLAEDPYVAEDAADLVELEIEPLDAVASSEAALAPGAPLLYPDWPDNVFVEVPVGPGADPAVFESAPIVLREQFAVQRQAASPMESRGVVAHYDPGDELVSAWISTQLAHHSREVICETLGWPEDQLRVVTPDVGGAFGLKESLFAEDVLVCLLARHSGRAVSWIEDRREAFIGSAHCRQCDWDLELAADEQGRILGLRGEVVMDLGGQPTGVGIGPARIASDMLPGPYRIENYGVTIRAVVTNKTPNGAYRGYGGPEAAFAIERLVDMLAERVGREPADVRKANFLNPEDFPYTSPTQHVYDSGDYEGALDRALERADAAGFEGRRAASAARGQLRGLGICSFVQSAGLIPSRILGTIGMDHGAHDTITLRMDSTGRATVLTGVSSQGQGHRTVLAQVCADMLGIEPSDVVVIQGDSDTTPYSAAGATASRTASVAGAALRAAAVPLREKLAAIAAHKLEAATDDIELQDGHARVVGSGQPGVRIAELARAALTGFDLPDDIGPGLEATGTFDPPGGTYPFGCHVAEIEIDPATGHLEILRYVVVNDCGVMLNPTIVEGQIFGAVAQGIGGALLEEVVYDATGQLLTASFLDYLLPTASDVPDIEIEHMVTPSPHMPGGVKGAGESGTLGPPAAIANAVANALGPDAPAINRLPFTPPVVWDLVRRSRGA